MTMLETLLITKNNKKPKTILSSLKNVILLKSSFDKEKKSNFTKKNSKT